MYIIHREQKLQKNLLVGHNADNLRIDQTADFSTGGGKQEVLKNPCIAQYREKRRAETSEESSGRAQRRGRVESPDESPDSAHHKDGQCDIFTHYSTEIWRIHLNLFMDHLWCRGVWGIGRNYLEVARWYHTPCSLAGVQ